MFSNPQRQPLVPATSRVSVRNQRPPEGLPFSKVMSRMGKDWFDGLL